MTTIRPWAVAGSIPPLHTERRAEFDVWEKKYVLVLVLVGDTCNSWKFAAAFYFSFNRAEAYLHVLYFYYNMYVLRFQSQ